DETATINTVSTTSPLITSLATMNITSDEGDTITSATAMASTSPLPPGKPVDFSIFNVDGLSAADGDTQQEASSASGNEDKKLFDGHYFKDVKNTRVWLEKLSDDELAKVVARRYDQWIGKDPPKDQVPESAMPKRRELDPGDRPGLRFVTSDVLQTMIDDAR